MEAYDGEALGNKIVIVQIGLFYLGKVFAVTSAVFIDSYCGIPH